MEDELHAFLALFPDERHWLASRFGYFIPKDMAALKSLHMRGVLQCLRGRPRDEITRAENRNSVARSSNP